MEDRIRYGFLITVSRQPSQTELAAVSSFYKTQEDEYLKNLDSAYKVIGRHEDNAAQLAAWTMVANVLLNSDEAITKE